MKWVMPAVIAFAMCFSPMAFPKSSAMADLVERTLEAVGPQPQDIPSHLPLYWQCVCVMGPEPQWYLLGGHFWRFLNAGETVARAVDVQLDAYQSSYYAHGFFVWHTARARSLVRKRVTRGPRGIKVAARRLTLPREADEQSSTAARLVEGAIVAYQVEVDFRVGPYVGYMNVLDSTRASARSDALRLIAVIATRIRENG